MYYPPRHQSNLKSPLGVLGPSEIGVLVTLAHCDGRKKRINRHLSERQFLANGLTSSRAAEAEKFCWDFSEASLVPAIPSFSLVIHRSFLFCVFAVSPLGAQEGRMFSVPWLEQRRALAVGFFRPVVGYQSSCAGAPMNLIRPGGRLDIPESR